MPQVHMITNGKGKIPVDSKQDPSPSQKGTSGYKQRDEDTDVQYATVFSSSILKSSIKKQRPKIANVFQRLTI